MYSVLLQHGCQSIYIHISLSPHRTAEAGDEDDEEEDALSALHNSTSASTLEVCI